MLMIEKKNDIQLLFHLGATPQLVKRIFLFEGLLTTAVGACIGLCLGLCIAWIQIQFEVLKMGNGSFVIDSYPVVVQPLDIFMVLLTVSSIGWIASVIPSRHLIKRFF